MAGDRKWAPQDVADYVERLVEMQLEMNDLRKEAVANGLKPPVLNWLVGQRAGNPADGGASIVNELLQYAVALNMPLRGIGGSEENGNEPAAGSDEVPASHNEMEQVTTSPAVMHLDALLAKEDRWQLPFPVVAVAECAMGVGLACLVVWLLL